MKSITIKITQETDKDYTPDGNGTYSVKFTGVEMILSGVENIETLDMTPEDTAALNNMDIELPSEENNWQGSIHFPDSMKQKDKVPNVSKSEQVLIDSENSEQINTASGISSSQVSIGGKNNKQTIT